MSKSIKAKENSTDQQNNKFSQEKNLDDEIFNNSQQKTHINQLSSLQFDFDKPLDHIHDSSTLRHRIRISNDDIKEIIKLSKDDLNDKLHELIDDYNSVINNHNTLIYDYKKSQDDYNKSQDNYRILNEYNKYLEKENKKLKGNIPVKSRKSIIIDYCWIVLEIVEIIVTVLDSMMQLNLEGWTSVDFKFRFNLAMIFSFMLKIILCIKKFPSLCFCFKFCNNRSRV